MSNPTSNFNWQMPTSSDLVTDLPADFEVFGQAVDTSLADLKGGTTGQVLSKTSATDMDFTWTTVSSSPFSPNLAINGAFIINQRGYTSGTNLASGSFGFDRWKSNYTNTALTFTAGINSTIVTISTSGGLQQVVERANVPAGTYTLSWSGTATGRVYNSGATPPSYAASPVSFTADGSANVVIEFTASGSSKTLSLVKFERGSNATTYSMVGDGYEGELNACCRYYFKDTAASIINYSVANQDLFRYYNFVVPMRVAPTLIQTGAAIETSNAVGSTFTREPTGSTILGTNIYFRVSASNALSYMFRVIEWEAEL